jgi:5-methylcytosine-specific restriction endonuclease McrA
MGLFDDLPVLHGQPGRPVPKPMPRAITKPEEQHSKKAQAKAFRDAVWDRDKKRSRASGKLLSKSGTDYDQVGEVHHVIPRSLAPERIYDVSNGLLLSKTEHALAETNCPNAPDKRLLDISGPDDRGEFQTFIWRDVHGEEVRRRVG